MSNLSKFLWLLFLSSIKLASFTNNENLVQEYGENYTFLIQAGYRPEKHILAKYIVSLRTGKPRKYFGDNHNCGGLIISTKSILTAAHCVTYKSGKVFSPWTKVEIIAGSPFRLKVTPTTRVSIVKRILVHPKYNKETSEADIAILYLRKEIELDDDTRSIVPLIDKEPKTDTTCTAFGWGQIFLNGPIPAELVYVDLKVLKILSCVFTNYLVCTTNLINYERHVGRGDSGGPLICDGVLAGLNSHAGFPQYLADDYTTMAYFNYFTSVFYYRDWIDSNVNDNAADKLNNFLLKMFSVLLFSFLL